MYSLRLDTLRLYGYHGVHEEEALLGGWFEADVEFFFDSDKKMIDQLSDTIDYVDIYERIKRCMQQPHALLETLCARIADDILIADNRVLKVQVKINKLNPPISNFSGKIGICLIRSRSIS